MFLAVALLARTAAGDAVVLLDGKRLTGKVTVCDEESCVVGSHRVETSTVARIELAERPSPSAKPGTIVLTDGTQRTGTFTGLNLGFVWLGDEEIERSEVAAIVLRDSAGSADAGPRPAEPRDEPKPAGEGTAQRGLVLLNELSDFIELVNHENTAVKLDGWSLRNRKGVAIELSGEIAAGGLLVVSLDRHPAFLDDVPGSLGLLADGEPMDGVTWGSFDPGDVLLCRGGRCQSPEIWNVLARLPGSKTAFASRQWASLDAEHATPGGANPYPPVSAFAAVDGFVFPRKAHLSWYGSQGAASYRIQVAADREFTKPLHEVTVNAAKVDALVQESYDVPALDPGDYFWRAQSIGTAGERAPFSRAISFSIDPAVGPAQIASLDEPRRYQSDGIDVRLLPVPRTLQRKDTAMLQLEAVSENNPRAWDEPDPETSRPYCARAAVASIVKYYGGSINIDRLSYEGFKDAAPGPELDLPETGMVDEMISKLLAYAIGTSGTYHPNGCSPRLPRNRRNVIYTCHGSPCPPCGEGSNRHFFNELWSDIKSEIDAGRPIVATNVDHVFLIIGYGKRHGRDAYVWLDESGTITADWSGDFVWHEGARSRFHSYWTGLGKIELARQENLVLDSDNDGMVDFDEQKRFKTRAGNPDSDDDDVKDKQDVRASIFDPEHGYARNVPRSRSRWAELDEIARKTHPEARDIDNDKLPMERDPDSDNGKCKDGQEDFDGDGVRESPTESNNFAKEDDVLNADGRCAEAWTGKVRYREWQRQPNGTLTDATYEINARMNEVRKLEIRDPEAMAQGKRGDLWATTIGFSCQGTAIRAVFRQNGPGISCFGGGSAVTPAHPAESGMIQRSHVERSLASLFGYEVPRRGLYMLGCDTGSVAAPQQMIHCTTPRASWSALLPYAFPVIGRPPDGPQATPRTDPSVRTLNEAGEMEGTYAGQEVDSNGVVHGAEASWRLCRPRVSCGEPPPLPSPETVDAPTPVGGG